MALSLLENDKLQAVITKVEIQRENLERDKNMVESSLHKENAALKREMAKLLDQNEYLKDECQHLRVENKRLEDEIWREKVMSYEDSF